MGIRMKCGNGKWFVPGGVSGGYCSCRLLSCCSAAAAAGWWCINIKVMSRFYVHLGLQKVRKDKVP